MENNLKMLEIVERIRKLKKEQDLETSLHLQQKKLNGQKENFSKKMSPL
ncbi:hypothetical protein J1C67_17635 [Clostridium gasigenes]|nr:hypothetical protein [Clostridium gasigenes]NKF05942.1 hypothetical protein [Clostridium gasigenes]QSW19332.1 hypothetical protein J1C67_17635 [Clostridium gasigenes]